jgi:sterol desaturase/sphingolipid hydroxylase (fatty acid hydroxylase superfamily)
VESLLGTIIVFILLAILFWGLELLWPDNRKQPRWRAGSLTDIAYFFFSVYVVQFLVTGIFLIFIVLTTKLLPRPGSFLINALPLWLQIPVGLLLADFIGYWVHRLTHMEPVLWRFHSIHHSSKMLDWLASVRVHPVNGLINQAGVAMPLYYLGFSPDSFSVLAPFLALYPIFLHANVAWNFGPLRYLIATPRFHRWHHTSEKEGLDKNFAGLFPIFDMLFGTYYYPKDKKPACFGLFNESIPDGLWRQMLYPLKKKYRVGFSCILPFFICFPIFANISAAPLSILSLA